MYFKLAFRNVKKSYKDYFIYFITLMFSVSLFYIFNSFERQSDILKMSQNQGMMVQALVEVMRVMSYFVAFVFGFLILYANNFLIKRRKKELGLYTLLGMQKTKISLLLILETVMVGVVSLFAGLVLGFVGSQATALLTAKLLAVSVNYAFVFSVGGALKTVLIFSLVFVVVIAFNRFILERYQLIDLIRAERQNEHSKVLNFGVSLVLFVLGVAVLITTYGYAMQPLMLPRHLPWIILSGVVATFMIFKALSGFIVTLIQSQKRIYYRKMTIFVTRQLSTKINATYKIMALVSLMLLLAMGALITGFNLNSVIERENDKKIAHDYTLTLVNANPKIVMKNAKYVTFDKHFVKQVSPLEIFTDYTQNAEAFAPYVKDANLVYVYKHESMRFVKASEFNDLRVYKGLEPVHIDDDSFAVFSQAIAFDGKLYQFQDGLKDSATLNVNGKTLTRVPLAEDGVKLTNGSELSSIYILLSDAQYNTLRDSKLERYSLNANWIVDLETGVDQEKFSRTVKDMLVMHGVDDFDIIGISEQALIDTQNGVKVMFTFIALYLGSVFLITSVVLLALQQLSEAGDNQKRYKTLSKIGVDEHMINRSLLIQMALYFFFPLTIALMHTYVGITAINMNLNIVGLKPTTLLPAIGTLVFIFVVYGAYFVVTYSGSKSIIRRKG